VHQFLTVLSKRFDIPGERGIGCHVMWLGKKSLGSYGAIEGTSGKTDGESGKKSAGASGK
jgi:hypothetical protein